MSTRGIFPLPHCIKKNLPLEMQNDVCCNIPEISSATSGPYPAAIPGKDVKKAEGKQSPAPRVSRRKFLDRCG